MKKEYKNIGNFIVKTTKNCEFLHEKSLIKVASIQRNWDQSSDVWTPHLNAPNNFQRFHQVRASIDEALKRSILGQSARSGAKMDETRPEIFPKRRGIQQDETDEGKMLDQTYFLTIEECI